MILHSIVRSYFSKKGGNKVYAAFIDFEKAYDKIPRIILIEKIHKFGLNGNIVNVIEDMKRNDKSCILIGDKRTEFFYVNNGVKQGYILSPTLFNMFLSDLVITFRHQKSAPAKLNKSVIGSLFWLMISLS